MKRIFKYKIPSDFKDRSISDYLSFLGYSSQNKTELKKIPESVMLNGVWSYMKDRLHEGDTLVISVEEKEASPNIVPRPLPLDIVYEDEDILVVNKTGDMPIHPSQNHYEDTLANAVMHYYNAQGIPYVFRCLNRLDRETSGLTVMAKNMVSGAILSRMVMNREMHREYIALVEGKTEESGTVDKPIGRKDGSTIERQIDVENGEHAVTHYKRLSYDEKKNVSKLLLWLETGRTHQIRVHMTSEGHPLLGDGIYNPTNDQMMRQALHSYRLTFKHPITGKEMEFTADVPEDMRIA